MIIWVKVFFEFVWVVCIIIVLDLLIVFAVILVLNFLIIGMDFLVNIDLFIVVLLLDIFLFIGIFFLGNICKYFFILICEVGMFKDLEELLELLGVEIKCVVFGWSVINECRVDVVWYLVCCFRVLFKRMKLRIIIGLLKKYFYFNCGNSKVIILVV